MRIGCGYDVHQLVMGRKLILGGVELPFDKGLLGHSDADVLVHAIMDALLGAAALGDIGIHFPDSDNRYKDATSLQLLDEVRLLLQERQYQIVNIDSIILAQAPKLSPHYEAMRTNIASVLRIQPDQVSVKATTEESLGFTGKGEGIAAKAICLIEKSQIRFVSNSGQPV